MIFIAHRGNTNGKTDLENHPIQITAAIQAGFDAEIDVWVHGKKLFLGHDNPCYSIDIDFLKKFSDNLWIHCKNNHAIEFFGNLDHEFNYFWHQEDDYTITSLGYTWIYPGVPLITGRVVAVMPETVSYALDNLFTAYAICSDHVNDYAISYKERDLK